MQMVSNLPRVQAMRIVNCPGFLRNVGMLPSLQTLEWADSSMMFLPNWMTLPIFPNLQRIYIMVADVLTLCRCLKDGPDWPKIQHIPIVFIAVMNGPEYIYYIKELYIFKTNLPAFAAAPPPPSLPFYDQLWISGLMLE
ncbi:hypothetical protein J5N97_015879 [Dioscorea zingiberensis]|uniref:Uncharacterized protein n=2 Tax=Dioscorea zingiberensis TaxID=325984 RepID=A0A9D5CJ97_9LILI|nr:hypothetical protein J5N97_015879 [Dioscorea zingiberensis]